MKNRYYGIDLLRIISIICVVMLHTLGRSELLNSGIKSQYIIAWFIETAAYFAVDCFGIISGFVNYRHEESRLKITNLLDLWLQVVFYGMTAVLLFAFFTSVDVTKGDLLTALLPLIRGEYWFFSAYAVMFLFSNVINRAVRNTDNRMLIVHILLLLFVVTMLESVTLRANEDYTLFDFEKGYNAFWLLVMYYIGAAIRKTELYRSFSDKKKVLTATIFLMVVFSWAWLLLMKHLNIDYRLGQGWDWLFIGYISPTIVLVAVLLVIMFSNMEMGAMAQKAISLIAPSAFSIYLLNSQPLIAKHIYNKDNLSFLLKYNGIKLVIALFAVCLAFVTAALLIDRIRIIIFKILRVRMFENRLQNTIDKKLLKV